MPRRLVAAVAALVLVFATAAGCAPESPVDASGEPLAQDDPDRYLPRNLLGARVRKLADHEQESVNKRLVPYGLDGWLSGVKVAIRSISAEDMDPAPAVVVVGSTTRDDPEMLGRLAHAWTGPGEHSEQEWIEIDGEDVLHGKLVNQAGRHEYVAWQVNPGIAVSIVSKSQSPASGWEPIAGMREEIAWATS